MGAVVMLVAALCAVALSAEQQLTPFVVTYVSLESVYLGGGRGAGLAIGDRLLVRSGDSLVPALEVIAVSTHSASCKNVRSSGALHTGDSVFIALQPGDSAAAPRAAAGDAPLRKSLELRPVAAASVGERGVHPTGSVSLRHNQWWDAGNSERNFAQSTGDLHLRVPRLWGTGLNVVLRANLRRDYRRVNAGPGVSGEEWTDRIYELSVIYDAPDAKTSVFAGRTVAPHLASIGYFDGLAVEQKMLPTVRAGLFAGMEPRWHYLQSRPPIQKYGGYLSMTRGNYQSGHINLVLALAGEFHGTTVSREAIHLNGRVGVGNRWDINHALELDINDGWRKRNTRSTISLSSLYLDGRYRLSRWLTTGLSYDNRKNYWTYETKSLVDSLFDYHVRHGVRARVDLTLPAGVICRGSVGYRNQEGQSNHSTSYTGGIDKRGFLSKRGTIGLQLSAFSGTGLNGRDLSLRVGQGLGRGGSVDLGMGQYSYQVGTAGPNRVNNWLECSLRTGITTAAFLSTIYRYSTGDDIVGHRLDLGCTYSF